MQNYSQQWVSVANVAGCGCRAETNVQACSGLSIWVPTIDRYSKILCSETAAPFKISTGAAAAK
jgi:hypothetical protein